MVEETLLTSAQLAERTKISVSYIYKHWEELGGFRIGRNVRFIWEDTVGRLLCSRKGLEIPVQIQKGQIYGCIFQNQARRPQGRSISQGGIKKPIASPNPDEDRDPHNLFGSRK